MKLSEEQYHRTLSRVLKAHPDKSNAGHLGGTIVFVDGEFNPVSDITEARWAGFENGYGYSLVHFYDDKIIYCEICD